VFSDKDKRMCVSLNSQTPIVRHNPIVGRHEVRKLFTQV